MAVTTTAGRAALVRLGWAVASLLAWWVWTVGWCAGRAYTVLLGAVLWVGTTVQLGWRDGRGGDHGNT